MRKALLEELGVPVQSQRAHRATRMRMLSSRPSYCVKRGPVHKSDAGHTYNIDMRRARYAFETAAISVIPANGNSASEVCAFLDLVPSAAVLCSSSLASSEALGNVSDRLHL
jgi:hypothetical protein